jgi:hypothetical protein
MKLTIEVDVLMVNHDEYVTIFSSGFEGSKIAVSENPAYQLSVWYPNCNQIKQMEVLDKRNREDLKKEKNDP